MSKLAGRRRLPLPFPQAILPRIAQSLHKPSLGRKRGQRARRALPVKWHLIAIVIFLCIPSFLIPYELSNVYQFFKQIQGQTQDGMKHLQAAANMFHNTANAGITYYLDVGKLRQAQVDIDLAHTDFASLNDELAHNATISLASSFWPAQMNTVRTLGHIAEDGTAVGQQIFKMLRDIAPSITLALQKSASVAADAPLTPYITPASYQEINSTLDAVTPLIQRMARNAQGLSLAALPISSKQQKTIASMLSLLPLIDTALQQRSIFREPLQWLLGIGKQRTFLVEPMDTAEVRATGGFTGQFGELVLNGGHVGPIKLSNIGLYEEDHTYEGSVPPDPTVFPKVLGQLAPGLYANWWPIPNFGMRDANLSADFPTSARIIMDRYSYEFGRDVDGVIIFTPRVIEDVLHVTGPITIPAYHQVITEYDLVDLLHYYQLDNAGIYQEEHIEHIKDTQQARKLFTQRVTAALMNAVTHLPLSQILPLANEMLQAMKTKDLQVYVTNAQVESLIGKYGSTASLDRSTTHDGLFIVQSNLSASKASQDVTTIIHDSIKLDTKGGVTHNLTLTLEYQQIKPVYGLDTYRDYIRIYVPEKSQFISGNGFAQYDEPYCGDAQSGYVLCQPDVYGDGSLVCATPIEIGYAASLFGDPYENRDHPLDRIGPPTNQQSDEPGRAMFGGWVVIPKNCTMKVTLSWYVPPMSAQPYGLLLQAQAGVYSLLEFTFQPPAGTCGLRKGEALHFFQTMNGEDHFFTIEHQGEQCAFVQQ
jgi:hypothetical protein